MKISIFGKGISVYKLIAGIALILYLLTKVFDFDSLYFNYLGVLAYLFLLIDAFVEKKKVKKITEENQK